MQTTKLTSSVRFEDGEMFFTNPANTYVTQGIAARKLGVTETQLTRMMADGIVAADCTPESGITVICVAELERVKADMESK